MLLFEIPVIETFNEPEDLLAYCLRRRWLVGHRRGYWHCRRLQRRRALLLLVLGVVYLPPLRKGLVWGMELDVKTVVPVLAFFSTIHSCDEVGDGFPGGYDSGGGGEALDFGKRFFDKGVHD